MLTNSHDFARPADEAERAYLEALVREDYDRCRVGETFDDMKRRMAFSRLDGHRGGAGRGGAHRRTGIDRRRMIELPEMEKTVRPSISAGVNCCS